MANDQSPMTNLPPSPALLSPCSNSTWNEATMSEANVQNAPAWKPMNSRQRRVLGVLVEKAKTTPDVYPMTVNGIVSGCNQKTNRDPVVTMTAEEVEEVLEQLRQLGAVTEVQGSGRVAK